MDRCAAPRAWRSGTPRANRHAARSAAHAARRPCPRASALAARARRYVELLPPSSVHAARAARPHRSRDAGARAVPRRARLARGARVARSSRRVRAARARDLLPPVPPVPPALAAALPPRVPCRRARCAAIRERRRCARSEPRAHRARVQRTSWGVPSRRTAARRSRNRRRSPNGTSEGGTAVGMRSCRAETGPARADAVVRRGRTRFVASRAGVASSCSARTRAGTRAGASADAAHDLESERASTTGAGPLRRRALGAPTGRDPAPGSPPAGRRSHRTAAAGTERTARGARACATGVQATPCGWKKGRERSARIAVAGARAPRKPLGPRARDSRSARPTGRRAGTAISRALAPTRRAAASEDRCGGKPRGIRSSPRPAAACPADESDRADVPDWDGRDGRGERI